MPYGVGAIEGQAGAPLPVLESGEVVGAASAPAVAAKQVYGPGEEPRPRDGEPTASAHGELL